MELDARMDDLECRQAFQDDTLQALNDVVVEQQRSIERLQLQVAALIKRLEDVQGLVGEAGKTKRLLPIIECTKPAVRRVFCFSRRSAAGGDHVFRLQALVPLYHRELHALAFDEDAVAFAANRSEVDEDVLARIAGNEAETF